MSAKRLPSTRRGRGGRARAGSRGSRGRGCVTGCSRRASG
jgi:hypothetical protein